ncbi:GTP-binding protein [Nostoc sp. DSM 114161]|jgi:GTPase SAR1 family protein|uniref:YcjF family protein n=1 Tax=Nostoc sp. DSM 114161 TaxID=3440143 RepID=UPI004045B10E
MVVKLQRPILVGGLGLSFSLWMLDTWHDSIVQVGEFGLLSALAVGGGLWLFQQNRPKAGLEQLDSMLVDRATVESAISIAEAVINQLAQEAENHRALETLREQVAQLWWELDRQEIKVAVTGGKSVGKSTLIQVLAKNLQTENLSLQETAPLFREAGENSDAAVLAEVAKSDFVLFLTNGDLTDTEFQTLQQLKAVNQPAMLVFNKQDQYLADERASVFLSLKQRMPGNVVATAASPIPVKVRKYEADGSVQEWMEQPAPDIQQLTQQFGEILAQQKQRLVWITTIRKARLLKAEAKNWLNGIRCDRATPIIEQYQWIAAAAAFANPVPALDILATAAINAQMVMDLGNIYQQKFSLEQAQTVAGTMGSLMLKLGLVELSTKAVSTVLKSNAVTFVAGGLVQGVSAAYLTRVAGLSLVEYFQQQEIATDSGSNLNLEKLRETLQKVFGQNQQIAFLQGFVKQGVKRLLPEVQQVEVVGIQKAVG